MMFALIVIVFSMLCIDADYALPVPTINYPGDEWNLLLLGVITVIGMGAILACVRCRRKKRGFELDHNVEAQEFKNEATKAERTATTVEAIRTEFPIFQALSTPSSPQFQQLDNESTRDSRDDLHHVDQVDILDELPQDKRLSCSAERLTIVVKERSFVEENFLERAPDSLAEETIILTFDSFEPEEKSQIFHHLTVMEAGAALETYATSPPPEDPEYESSVEQVLRELDIAIGDNDDPAEGSDQSDDEAEEREQSDSDDHLENVLRQLFIDNMLSSLSSTESEAVQQLPENVIETETGSNELLDEESAADENPAETIINATESCEREQFPLSNRSPVHAEIEVTENDKSLSPSNTFTDGQPEEDILFEENFFNNLPTICQSTPSVRNKRQVKENCVDGGARLGLTFDEEVSMSDETFSAAKCTRNEGEMEKELGVDSIPVVTVCQVGTPTGDQTFEVLPSGGGGKEKSDHYLKDNNATITPVNTPIEVNFEYEEKEKRGSTAELPDAGDATFTKDSEEGPTKGGGGWFLHPQASDETFDFDNLPPPPPPLDLDYEYNEEYDEEQDSDGEYGSSRANMDFDALRKQLADLLPHAQGAPAIDDEGAVGGSCESGMPANVLEAMLNNIDPSPMPVAESGNYKRPLSPIMEESEEENTTIKTSILNDTKNMDSTSTGCIETLSEAVMGVTRTLMASNDTLFNFEDTLGDREDLTPTPMAGGTFAAVGAAAASAASPINGTYSLNDSSSTVEASDCTFAVAEKKQKPNVGAMTLDLSAVRPDNYSNALDVTSPEQLKTFSEDITSVEHVSGSDASGNMDPDGTYTTNTIEMETCISLNKDEGEECDLVEDLEKDERVSDHSEGSTKVISVNNRAVDDDDDDSSEEVNCGTMCSAAETDEEKKTEARLSPVVDVVEQTKLFLAREVDHSRWHKVSTRVDAAVFHVSTVEQVPNLEEMGLEKCLTSAISRGTATKKETSLPGEDESNNNITFDVNENCQSGGHNNEEGDHGDCYLSGEEDPWMAMPRNKSDEGVENDSSNNHDQVNGGEEEEEMVTVFNSDWDRDSVAGDSDNNGDSTDEENEEQDVGSADSSDDSSEEFMYVQGSNRPTVNGETGNSWDSHVDKIPVAKKEENKFETVAEEEEGDGDEEASDADGEEFVPSCWNSDAKPSRSAMKSPDKSSSDEDSKDGKRRPRNVAFKKQQYHNVYEYPREMNPLSPSLSEPTFSINFRDQASMHAPNSSIGVIDGFMISSSTRPFQGNQCNTWPTENDFSWSQQLSSDGCSTVNATEGTVVYSEIPIEWPRKVIVDADGDDSGSESNPVPRPDSGVGESAEFLNDTVSLGELCHTKASLRLPLINAVPPVVSNCVSAKEDSDEELPKESSSDENMVLPTPSCTGSMDSLSSSSCSDRQMISFTTFGKVTPQSSLDDSTSRYSHSANSADIIKLTTVASNGPEVVAEEEEERSGSDKCGNQRGRISDSTDEDSGIENISRKIM